MKEIIYRNKRFIQSISEYTPYLNDMDNSIWWVNPTSKEWIFQLKDGNYLTDYTGEQLGNLLLYNTSWSNEFKLLFSIDDDQFNLMIKSYIKSIIPQFNPYLPNHPLLYITPTNTEYKLIIKYVILYDHKFIYIPPSEVICI
jgi:hypothetical protein